MQIAKPQVHLRKNLTSGDYMIHSVTWMDRTKFVTDGYEALPMAAVSGVYTVILRIKEDTEIPDMELLTPIVHTLDLPGLDLDIEPFIEVKLINTYDNDAEMGKRKTHNQDSDDSGMPTPKTRQNS